MKTQNVGGNLVLGGENRGGGRIIKLIHQLLHPLYHGLDLIPTRKRFDHKITWKFEIRLVEVRNYANDQKGYLESWRIEAARN